MPYARELGAATAAPAGDRPLLAALDGDHLHLLGESARAWPLPDDASAADWLDWMTGGIAVLYVHASALPRLGLPAELELPAPGERPPPHPWLQAGELDRRALAPWITDGAGAILIGAYQDGAGDPFADLADGAQLLDAARIFRDAFESAERPRGWTFMHSASGTGWRLMHAPWKYGRRKLTLADGLEQPEPQPLQDAGQVEIPFGAKWAREQPPHDGWLLDYAHAYDVNGQRLAACSRLDLGVGTAIAHVRGPANTAAGVHEGRPGYVQVRSFTDPFPGLIPPPFEAGWHTTPRVRMAQQLGIPMVLGDAYFWERSVTYLDPFYRLMRDARRRLAGFGEFRRYKAAAAAALGALKQGYLQPLGRLRSARSLQRGDRLYRPSWYDQVIGRELGLEYLRLHQLATEGADVLAVYFDAIIIESNTANPRAAAPPPLECSDQLGKFKPAGTLTAERAHQLLYPGGGATDHNALMRAMKARR